MRVAHDAARLVLPGYRHKFSRHDFTLAELFACLVVREMMGKSYRRTEALLRDTDWCQQLGMTKVPDHATLCRAFAHILNRQRVGDMLSLFARVMRLAGKLGQTLAIDSTLYDTHHHSRHYERRCLKQASDDKSTANARRSRKAKRTPKLAIGADTRSHLITAGKSKTGMGSDAPDFEPLLRAAVRRSPLREVLADPGYDSEHNHELARDALGVRSRIKATAGRPGTKPAAGRYRRQMQRQLRGSQAGKPYGQRAQAETVMSMLKRNLGDSLRARSDHAREMELLLKVLTHDVMIIRRCV